MKFNPCNDKCTYEGSHCQGCGRSHQEIADTKNWSCRLSTLFKTKAMKIVKNLSIRLVKVYLKNCKNQRKSTRITN